MPGCHTLDFILKGEKKKKVLDIRAIHRAAKESKESGSTASRMICAGAFRNLAATEISVGGL